jgi:UDP-GlcNAc:undecaprenyl-phosphate GlcNAc-1-phosphate transferase
LRAYLLLMLVAALVTGIATYFTLRFSKKRSIMPEIRDRDSHTIPTPRIGGFAMLVGLLVSLVVAASIGWFKPVFANPVHILAIALAAIVITILGILDDLVDLDWTLKLAGQIIAAGILAWQGVQLMSLPIAGLTIGSFGTSLVLSIFLIVLVMNAVNFIDGLDGLVAGVVLIGTMVFFTYSYLLAQQTSPTNYFNLASMISAIVIGICVGFLPFNWHRAKIFMGDSGAMLLGLLMATSALSVTGQIDPKAVSNSVFAPAFLPLILPLAILLLPVLDLTLAVVRRLRAGKSPFTADRKHIHHKLQDFGHSHLGSVMVFYLWTALISLGSLSLLFVRPVTTLILFFSASIPVMLYTMWPVLAKRMERAKK